MFGLEVFMGYINGDRCFIQKDGGQDFIRNEVIV